MTTTTTETKTKSTKQKVLTSNTASITMMPSLLTKAITSNSTSIAVPSIAYPTSPIATGSFYLPLKQKNKRNGRYHHKHLRKPPSFDTYISYSNSSTSSTTYGYMTRTPSISSSYSSTSSLADNEDMMYGYGFNNKSSANLSVHSPRLRRGSSAYKVRFAEDDGSSIVSSSSGGSCVDEWDDVEIEEEEEDFILVAPHPPRTQFYNYHNKSSSE